GAGGPSFGEERSVEEVAGLRRRDALATRRHQTALPAAADRAPRLVLPVTRRLVDEQEPLDVGDRRITCEVPLDRLGDVDRLRLTCESRVDLLRCVLGLPPFEVPAGVWAGVVGRVRCGVGRGGGLGEGGGGGGGGGGGAGAGGGV